MGLSGDQQTAMNIASASSGAARISHMAAAVSTISEMPVLRRRIFTMRLFHRANLPRLS